MILTTFLQNVCGVVANSSVNHGRDPNEIQKEIEQTNETIVL